MNKEESVLENETHNILWNFEIETDQPAQTRRPYLVLMSKKKGTCHQENFVVPTDYRIKTKKWEMGKDIVREMKRW